MKNLTAETIRFDARRKYQAWIAGYGLKNAKKVHAEMGRLLRGEEKRRKKLVGS